MLISPAQEWTIIMNIWMIINYRQFRLTSHLSCKIIAMLETQYIVLFDQSLLLSQWHSKLAQDSHGQIDVLFIHSSSYTYTHTRRDVYLMRANTELVSKGSLWHWGINNLSCQSIRYTLALDTDYKKLALDPIHLTRRYGTTAIVIGYILGDAVCCKIATLGFNSDIKHSFLSIILFMAS